MCGRVRTPNEINEIRIELRIKHDRIGDAYHPRYNLAPTNQIPVVTSANGERTLEWMRWGLFAPWAKDGKGPPLINARADTVATKNPFSGAWKAGRRCLVVTDGFYEWRKTDKQPFAVGFGNKQPMYMAGLWQDWKPTSGDPVRCCTIITTEANPLMEPIHDRMPVIIAPDDYASWLGEEPLPDATTLLKPFPESRLQLWPVDKAVGKVSNQGPQLAEAINI